MTSMDTLVWIFLTLFLAVGFGAIYFIITYMRSNRLIVRSADSNRILGYYWVVTKENKSTKAEWWETCFFHKKIRLVRPPDECIKVNKRGKSWVDVYETSEGEYIYILDKGVTSGDVMIKSGKSIASTLQPFTEVQRATLVNSYAKAEKMRKTAWLKENAMNIISLGALTFIIIMGMVYWGEFAQFALQKDAASTGLLQQATKTLNEIKGGAVEVIPSTSVNGVVQQGTEEPPEE